MKKEFELSSSKFIYTKEELGYQEILDDFINAKEIIIVTYNISEKHTMLFNKLRDASQNTKISIFTNIPTRWDTYFGDSYRWTTRKKIDVYLSKLKPETIGKDVSVFFNFENHGKIVMTDNVVYVGSANFSDESKNNSEFGVISRDKSYISFLKEVIIDDLVSKSTPYFEYDYLPLIIDTELHLSNLFSLKNELFEQVYLYYEDLDSHGFHYNDLYEMLSQSTIDNILSEFKICSDLLGEIYDAVDKITKDDNVLEEINEYYEICSRLNFRFEETGQCETIYRLAHFDSSEKANEILQDRFSAEAYDEYLEKYIEKSTDIVNTLFKDLCVEAKPFLDDLIKIAEEYLDNCKECIKSFKELEYRKINKSIDNTYSKEEY